MTHRPHALSDTPERVATLHIDIAAANCVVRRIVNHGPLSLRLRLCCCRRPHGFGAPLWWRSTFDSTTVGRLSTSCCACKDTVLPLI